MRFDPQNPTAEMLLWAYAQGAFPMADPTRRGRPIEWYCPDPRGIIPLDAFHVPVNLGRVAKQGRFEIRSDTAFEAVFDACATGRSDWNLSWMNDRLRRAYLELHREGFAHSLEAWLEGRLVGGLYGVHLRGAFFGESMFSRPPEGTNASKVCLVHLVERIRRQGFTLLDTQFVNPHLQQFGCVAIPAEEYLARLAHALTLDVGWT